MYGYLFGSAAYLTDHSDIPEESHCETLADLDVLFLDALRHKPHPTHTTVSQALEYVEQLSPKRAFFTHISHDLPHEETEREFPEDVRLAYDGLRITVGELAECFESSEPRRDRCLTRGRLPSASATSTAFMPGIGGCSAAVVEASRRERLRSRPCSRFDPHPTQGGRPDRAPKLLTTTEAALADDARRRNSTGHRAAV